MQDDIGSAEQRLFEPVQCLGQRAVGVFLLDDDAAKDKHRVLRINDRQIVVAGFVEKENLHATASLTWMSAMAPIQSPFRRSQSGSGR